MMSGTIVMQFLEQNKGDIDKLVTVLTIEKLVTKRLFIKVTKPQS